MSDYGAREETRAYQNDRENQMRDMATWPCNHLTLLDAAKIVYPANPELVAKLERANKIDRLKAELRLKAEELRASEQEQALRDSPNEPLTNEELDVMLDKMNRDYMAAKQAEEGTESRAYPQRLNPHP